LRIAKFLAAATLGGCAAASNFQAATASAGSVRALALEDGKGTRAVIAQADFPIAQSLADFVAAQLLRDYNLDRSRLLLRWSGSDHQPSHPEDLVTAIAAALGQLEAAQLRYGHGVLSVARAGSCLAAIGPDATLRFDGCAPGEAVTGAIRGAFQMVEAEHGLARRGDLPPTFPVQALAIGKQVRILALSGAAAMPVGVDSRGLIFAAYSNAEAAAPLDDRVRAAIESVLARVSYRGATRYPRASPANK
jgi:hypothetical protein